MDKILVDHQGIELLYVLLITSIVCSIRSVMLVFSIPYFLTSFPNVVKIGIGVSLSFVTFPLVLANTEISTLTTIEVIIIVFKEALLGFILGVATGIVYWGCSFAGYILDYQRGNFSLGGGVQLEENGSPISTLLTQLLTFYFFSSGAFLFLVKYLHESYLLWPVASKYPQYDQTSAFHALSMLDILMEVGLVMAGPVIIVLLIIDATFGLAGRFAQQFNVFSLSLGVKSLAVTFVMLVYIPYMLSTSFFEELLFADTLANIRLLLE